MAPERGFFNIGGPCAELEVVVMAMAFDGMATCAVGGEGSICLWNRSAAAMQYARIDALWIDRSSGCFGGMVGLVWTMQGKHGKEEEIKPLKEVRSQ
eukprot:g29600.t1